jgi:hypothetical protein
MLLQFPWIVDFSSPTTPLNPFVLFNVVVDSTGVLVSDAGASLAFWSGACRIW